MSFKHASPKIRHEPRDQLSGLNQANVLANISSSNFETVEKGNADVL